MSRRSLAFGICFLLMCSAFIPMGLGFNVKVSKIEQLSMISNGKTLYVGGSGPDNYTKIQDAINDAVDSDTVYVYDDSSPYNENIDIDKSINLIGENKEYTLIESDDDWPFIINILEDRVNISGFTVRTNSNEFKYGIHLHGNNCSITDNIFSEMTHGIHLSKSIFNTISGNTFFNNSNCINFYHSNYNYIEYNIIILDNLEGVGFTNSNNNIISNNYISKSHRGISISRSNNNIIINNTVINNTIGMIFSGNNNTIYYNNISSNEEDGISIIDLNNSIITNNKISNNNEYGIFIATCYNITISENIILNHKYGIVVTYSAEENTIIRNNISLNKIDGIILSHTNNNTIKSNNITYNNDSGINFHDANKNIVTDNNIMINNYGINVDYNCFDNKIYHNNFINNEENANDECNTYWDDGRYGNYWDDYKEKHPFARRSLLKPWMWNTPYEIEGGDNKDRCPLVNKWPDPRPRTITRDTPLCNPVWLRFFDMFPILQSLLLRLGLQ